MHLATYLRTAGPALSPAEIQATLRGHGKTTPVPAILDLLADHCLNAYATATGEPATLPHPEDRAHQAGRAAALEDFFEQLTNLLEGK